MRAFGSSDSASQTSSIWSSRPTARAAFVIVARVTFSTLGSSKRSSCRRLVFIRSAIAVLDMRFSSMAWRTWSARISFNA